MDRMMNIVLTCLLLSSISLAVTDAAVIRCATISQIEVAVANVQPGDEIVIAAGTYYSPTVPSSWVSQAQLTSQTAGTADNRITLRGEDPDDPPTIFGTDVSFWSVIRLRDGAHYWTIQDLILGNAGKGVIVDGSDYVELIRLQVSIIGEEAIHIRDGSKNTLIEGCKISDTGRIYPGYGEAIYIGTDRGDHDLYAPDVAYTTIRNCEIGPDVRGEPFDVKEGTFETIIEYCTVDATGLSGINFADSFVDIKGTRTYVRFNEFFRNGETSLAKGVAIIDREVVLSAFENVIHDNTFDFDDQSNIALVQAGGRTVDTIAFDNEKVPPGGSQYSGSVTQSCCPDWYDRPDRATEETPAPTPAEPPIFGCFSSTTTVELETGESIRMDDLAIGDKVLVQDGKYDEVYSFGHRNSTASSVFVSLTSESSTVELSGDHMLWIENTFIPASAVEVGHVLSNGEIVNAINIVSKNGVYAPFTSSGTVVVSGILCSSFVTMQANSAYLMVGSVKMPLTWQWIAHTFEAPHRFFSILGETYTADGVSNWVAVPRKLVDKMLRLPLVLQVLFLIPSLILLLPMAMLANSANLSVILAVASYILLVRRRARRGVLGTPNK